MNLHEDIQRIKEVMGIITEGNMDIFQSLLSNALENVKKDCEDIDAESFPNDLSFQSCDEGEWVSKITIIEYKWENSEYSGRYKKGTPLLVLTVDVHIQTVNRYEPNSLLFDLGKRMSDWVGGPVHLQLDNIIYVGVGINESALSSLKRRMGELPRHVRSTYYWLNPKAFYDFDEFIDKVIFSTIRDFVSELGINDYEREIEVREEVTPFIRQYIMDNHLEEIRDYHKKETKG